MSRALSPARPIRPPGRIGDTGPAAALHGVTTVYRLGRGTITALGR